jgi:N-acetylglucosaminyldiphosphoundecaprenol N-acetyl-beta-D-mannosaminyltransferase
LPSQPDFDEPVYPVTSHDSQPLCAEVLGAPVHVIALEDVLQLMEQWIREHEPRRWIAVTGSHGVVEAHKHPDFRAVLRSADLSVPDGNWAARVAAKKLSCATRQVRGADLLAAFCELASRKGYTSYFYGDTEEILALAGDRLRKRYPGLKIVGAYSPPFREPTAEEDAQAVARINQANPDVLWVALGLPKQEKWIAAHRERVKAPIIVAVGAAIKFHSGKVKPAPRWASQSGMEWFWRFLHEPRRTWRRAFVYGPQFAVLSLLDLSGLKKFK